MALNNEKTETNTMNTNMSRPEAQDKASRGFTLIEVIVIVSIVAILAVAAIPYYQSLVVNSRLDNARSTCQLIAAAILHANNRGLAITANSWSLISMTDPSNSMWTFTFPAATSIDATYAITATGTGVMTGKSGSLKPRASGAARWTGDIAGGP